MRTYRRGIPFAFLAKDLYHWAAPPPGFELGAGSVEWGFWVLFLKSNGQWTPQDRNLDDYFETDSGKTFDIGKK